MQAGDPARPASAHREREPSAIAPFLGTPLDRRRLHIPPTDSLQRVADDELLGGELRVIAHVLYLAAPTPVARVVRALRLYTNCRGCHYPAKRAPRKMSPAGYPRCYYIAGCGPRYENHQPFVAADAVTPGGNRIDRNADDVRHQP